MGDVILRPSHWFATMARRERPASLGIVISFPADRAWPHLDEVTIFRRAINLRAERARRSECSVYTSDDDGSAA